jgi:hypothetical protein
VNVYGSFSEPIVFGTKSIVLCTFVAHGYLGLCCHGPRIKFVSPGGVVVATVQVSAPGPCIKECYFSENSVLICGVGNHICTGSLTKTAIESEGVITVQSLYPVNVAVWAVNDRRSEIAAGFPDGSVVLLDLCPTPDSQPREIVAPGAAILRLFWIAADVQLASVRADGSLIIWNSVDSSSFLRRIPELGNHRSSDFDAVSHSLLFVDGKALLRISFCCLLPPFCVTARSVYSLDTRTKLASLDNCPSVRSSHSIAL